MRLFGAGAMPGFLVGLIAISYLNGLGNAAAVENAFRLVVGAYIVLTTWVPLARHIAQRREAPMAVGIITTFMSIFVGGMGASIASALEGSPASARLGAGHCHDGDRLSVPASATGLRSGGDLDHGLLAADSGPDRRLSGRHLGGLAPADQG